MCYPCAALLLFDFFFFVFALAEASWFFGLVCGLFFLLTLYFVYQNNYNQFVKYYRDTFQHGGISLEEMLIPFVTLEAK